MKNLCECMFENISKEMNVEAFNLIKALDSRCKIRVKKTSVVIAFNYSAGYCRIFFNKDHMDFVLRYNSTVRSGVKTFKILNVKTLQELKQKLHENIDSISNCKTEISKDAKTKLCVFKHVVEIL